MPYVSRRDEARREVREALGPVAERMAEETSREIRDLMERSDPSGETYAHPDGGTYQASAPGEPPAIRTRQYLESYGSTDWHLRESERRAVAAVTSDRMLPDNSPLWPHLEYGTSRVAPRPHVRPAAEIAAERFRAAARSASQRGGGRRELLALPAAA